MELLFNFIKISYLALLYPYIVSYIFVDLDLYCNSDTLDVGEFSKLSKIQESPEETGNTSPKPVKRNKRQLSRPDFGLSPPPKSFDENQTSEVTNTNQVYIAANSFEKSTKGGIEVKETELSSSQKSTPLSVISTSDSKLEDCHIKYINSEDLHSSPKSIASQESSKSSSKSVFKSSNKSSRSLPTDNPKDSLNTTASNYTGQKESGFSSLASTVSSASQSEYTLVETITVHSHRQRKPVQVVKATQRFQSYQEELFHVVKSRRKDSATTENFYRNLNMESEASEKPVLQENNVQEKVPDDTSSKPEAVLEVSDMLSEPADESDKLSVNLPAQQHEPCQSTTAVATTEKQNEALEPTTTVVTADQQNEALTSTTAVVIEIEEKIEQPDAKVPVSDSYSAKEDTNGNTMSKEENEASARCDNEIESDNQCQIVQSETDKEGSVLYHNAINSQTRIPPPPPPLPSTAPPQMRTLTSSLGTCTKQQPPKLTTAPILCITPSELKLTSTNLKPNGLMYRYCMHTKNLHMHVLCFGGFRFESLTYYRNQHSLVLKMNYLVLARSI